MNSSTEKKKIGRPKGTEPAKKLVTLRLAPEKLQKIIYIAWFQRDSLTDVIESAVELEIKKFERANGTITEDQIKLAVKKKR